jgi:hypothetical protein
MKRIAFVLFLMVVAGCAASIGHLNTPSGKPEVTVNANMKVAAKECYHFLLANGFSASTKNLSLSGNQLLDNGNTNIWIMFNFFQVDSATTTIYATKVIWYKYRGGNRPQTTQADYEELQGYLNEIAQNLSGAK